MKKYSVLLAFILCATPFCANGQPLGPKAMRALGKASAEILSKDVAAGAVKNITKGAAASAAARSAVSAASAKGTLSGAAQGAAGSISTDKITAEIVNSELEHSGSAMQTLRTDWNFIGGIMNKQKELASFQSQLEESEKRLTRTVLDMANTSLARSRKDLSQQIKTLAQNEQDNVLLLTEESKQAFLQAVNDIMDFGLYGGLADVSLLYKVYEPVAETEAGQLLLVPVVRAVAAMGVPERAEQIALNAPQSSPRQQLISFLQYHPTVKTNNFRLDFALRELKPTVADLTEEQLFAFDFSPQATAYWMQLSKRVRNSIEIARRIPTNRLQPKKATAAKPAAPTVQAKVAPGSVDVDLNGGDVRLQPVSPEGMTAPQAAPVVSAAPIKKSVLNNWRKNGAYPSGLTNESQLIDRWMTDSQNGYFRPRNQIETIEGMSPEKANNIIEYLYYMNTEEGERVILKPILENSRLPDFMYDNKLISNTQRLPFMYYKNKFNDNVKRLVELADGERTLYSDRAELKDLLLSMKDYTFEQGFAFTNSEELATALQKRWEVIVREVTQENAVTDRALINQLWHEPVTLMDGTKVSLRDYFTQTRPTAFFPDGAMPEFYLNSPKWVAWENVRRDLISKEILPTEPDSFINKAKKMWAGVDNSNYLTLEQFGKLMTSPYLKVYKGMQGETTAREGAVSTIQSTAVMEDHIQCIDEQIRQNNFDVIGGVCMSSFGDGGYLGNRDPNYDGTSLRSRYEAKVFDNVDVVVFNDKTLKPEVTTVQKVSYLKDLKKPDPYKEKASRMVGDGIDETRDLLSVQSASKALLQIPSLRATIRPQNRISYAQNIPNMNGGGMAGYLALFTPDFYPIKKVKLLREVDGKKQWVTEYFIRREVVALSGFIHRERLTFSSQINMREQAQPAAQAVKADIQKAGGK